MVMETVRSVYTVVHFSPPPSPPEKEVSRTGTILNTTVQISRVPSRMVGTDQFVKSEFRFSPLDHGIERTGTALLFHTVMVISRSTPRKVLETDMVVKTESGLSPRQPRESRYNGLN